MKRSLTQLYKEHAGKVSDKWDAYLELYEHLFRDRQDKSINILEIGVQNGGSLEIYARYFEKAEAIVGCDIDPKCDDLKYDDERISVIVGSITSQEILSKINEFAPFDIIIDDGSHSSGDIVKAFFPCMHMLKEGGIYIAEDLHCSYWQNWEGGLFYPWSSIAFFKHLADTINYEHWADRGSRRMVLEGFATKYDCDIDDDVLTQIRSISFFNSICTIEKRLKNTIGKRVIVGTASDVVPFDTTQNQKAIQPIQICETLSANVINNIWNTVTFPPEEVYEELILEVSEKNRIIEEKVQLIKEKSEEINNLNGRIDQLDQINSKLVGALSSVLNSTSWKITHPIRLLWRMVKKSPDER